MAFLEASVPRTRAQRKPLALPWLFPTVSFALDVILINLAFATAYWLRYVVKLGGPIKKLPLPTTSQHIVPYHCHGKAAFCATHPPLPVHAIILNVPYQQWAPFELLITGIMVPLLLLSGIYRRRLGLEWLGQVFAVARTATVGMGLAIIITQFATNLVDLNQYSRGVVVYTWLLIMLFCALGRLATQQILIQLHRRGRNVRRVIVAGSTTMGKIMVQNLSERRDHGYQLVGFLHENGGAPQDFGRFPNLGPVSRAAEAIDHHEVDEVVIALTATSHEDILSIRDHCTRRGVAFKIVPDLFEMSLSRVRMDEIAGIPLIDVVESPLRGANLVLKRCLDVSIALGVLVLLSPLLLLVALAILVDSGRPIMIAQERVGRDGKTFPFFKFRSMRPGSERLHGQIEEQVGEDQPMIKHKSDPRRTRVGRVIRKLSIDELPQLLNVLRGEMGLVGPRPALPREVAKYESWHHKRFDATPGMTGLWQVSGRSDLNFDEMVMMDIYYIDNWSLALDLKILLRTPAAVLLMRGAY
jgi:exopolysaccharide biosynthesis polyprenyl glycosylphosphotransferase